MIAFKQYIQRMMYQGHSLSITLIHKFLFISRNFGKRIIDSSGVLFNRKGKVKKCEESDKETR